MIKWRTPIKLPDLRRAGIIALDLETRDDRLRADMGSGWPFKAGYICGVSVAWRAGGKIRAHYLPLCHPDSSNFDSAQVYQWLRDLVASDVRIVTQNGIYDWGWLCAEAGIAVPPSDRLEEIGALATIVDENQHRYSLDALCKWRGLPGKDEAALKEGAAALGLSKRAKPAPHIWQMPARYVARYAEQDATATLALFENLNPILDQEGTREAYRLEVDLLPMVLAMRRRGIRIDVDAAERARDRLLQKRDAIFAEISDKLGANVGMAEIGRSKWLAETFDKHGIAYPRTAKSNPSFTAGNSGWMPRHPHWLPPLIVKADKLNNATVNFLQHYILDHVVNGRVHAEIHPHRSDEGGTRSLRFSYSDPPLQLMPAHDEELTALIRGVFLPEQGQVWAKPDISQQEFRLIVHYAARHKLPGAQRAVERYRTDPDTDFHAFVAELTGIARKSAKNTNFAKAYGAGVRKFAAMINQREGDARVLYEKYDRALPFVHLLSKLCQRMARRQGYIELYDGARRHWSDWVAQTDWSKGAGPCPRDEAERRIKDSAHPWYGKGPLMRADTHKAMNALIQGSAARHTKLWMRAVWREGITPLLQMHDCLDLSVNSREQAELVARLGCEAVRLDVAMRVDLKFGRSWGDAKHTWAELHQGMSASGGRSGPIKITHQRSSLSVEPAAVHCAPVEKPTNSRVNGHVASTLVIPDQGALETLEQRLARIPLADLIGTKPIDGKIKCPFHEGDNTPSLHIYPDHYHCYAANCQAHGNHLDWLREAEGLDTDAAIDVIFHWQGRTASPRRGDDDADRARKFRRAMRLWQAAAPIAGTLAAHYLAKWRRIDLAALPDDVDASLRFHPQCIFDLAGPRPCLIVLMRDVLSNEPVGIQRIALAADGNRIERRMLGGAGAVKLWPADAQLIVGEGLETTLAAATRILHHGAPLRPAWAALSGLALSRLPVISNVERLLILVDHDVNGQGQAAAAQCADRWGRAGRSVTQLKPKRPGDDFNDVVMRGSKVS